MALSAPEYVHVSVCVTVGMCGPYMHANMGSAPVEMCEWTVIGFMLAVRGGWRVTDRWEMCLNPNVQSVGATDELVNTSPSL